MARAEHIKAKMGLTGPPLQRIPGPPPAIPDHEMLRCIGQGSYGEVWLARNAIGTWRAVKVVYRERFKDARPYEREFAGIQKYEPISRSNEGLVDVLQIGRNDPEGYFYYVMELADDASPVFSIQDPASYFPRTLAREIQSRDRLPVEECITLGLTLNLALGHLHRHGLIHRDVKPSNIIFVNGVAKLADIGLLTDVSAAQSFVGTEGFIPPEGPNSAQADIYAIGKVLYEASMGKDRQEFPEPFTDLALDAESKLLMELNAVLLRACAPNPKLRYKSAEEMNADLALLHSGQSVKGKHALEQRLKIVTRIGIAAVAAILLGAIPCYLAIREAILAKSLASKEAVQRERADRAAQNALENAARAKAEAVRSFQVAQILKNMLKGAGPAKARGRDATILIEILDQTAAGISQELVDQPSVESDLQDLIGSLYLDLGRFLDAEAAFCRAVDLNRQLSPDGSLKLAEALNDLAVALKEEDKLQEAESVATEALAMRRGLLGDAHVEVAQSIGNLGAVLEKKGNLREAEALYSTALAADRELLGEKHTEVASWMNNLGVNLKLQSRFAEAEVLLSQAMSVRIELLGNDHPHVGQSRHNLAALLYSEGKFAAAEELDRAALQIDRKVLGADHPWVATDLVGLGRVLAAQGKLEEAETVLREALTTRRKTFGNDHSDIAVSLYQLAIVLKREGKLDEAEAAARDSLDIMKRLPDGDLGASLNNLGLVLQARSKLGEAECMFRDALAFARLRYGEQNAAVATCLRNLSNVLKLEGRSLDPKDANRQAAAVQGNLLSDSSRTEDRK